MDYTPFRILDVLSRELGKSFSINELTKKIAETHGTAYYANIYRKLHDLAKKKIVILTKVGKASMASLNFENYMLIDLLTEMELTKKQDFLSKRPDLQMLFMEIDTQFKDFVKSLCIIDPYKNIKLNRVELLILQNSKEDMIIQHEGDLLHTIIQKLQSIHNMKIDYLTLSNLGFTDFLKSDEINPLTGMLSKKIAFLSPQAYWMEIKEALEKGLSIKLAEKEIIPSKITDQALLYNLARFGYKEFGSKIIQGPKICIEYIVTSVLMKNDARRILSIPIILAKNYANYNLLMYLYQKYDLAGILLGLLKGLEKIKPVKQAEQLIKIMEARGIKKIKVDEESLREKMRLYNVA